MKIVSKINSPCNLGKLSHLGKVSKMMPLVSQSGTIKHCSLAFCLWAALVLGGLLSPGCLWAQKTALLSQTKIPVVRARNLAVGCHTTCMLIFPAAIQSADRGAAYVLASRVRGAENVLKVKAGSAGFAPSSLTVITSDGKVYAFNVTYQAKPPYLVLDFRLAQTARQIKNLAGKPALAADSGRQLKTIGKQPLDEALPPDNINQQLQQSHKHYKKQPALYGNNLGLDQNTSRVGRVKFTGVPLNTAEISRCMDTIKVAPTYIKRVHKNQFGVDFKLAGVYFYKDVLFFKFRLQNKGGIPFKTESLRLFVRDNKMARRTAVEDQELDVWAIKTWGQPENKQSGQHGSGQQILVAVPSFTIADNKRLAVVLRERNGDRTLLLMVSERKLRRTQRLRFQN